MKKLIITPGAACFLAAIALIVQSCGKASNVTPAGGAIAPTPVPTTTDLLTGSPWKISLVTFMNTTTQIYEGVPLPDSLKNLVLTLKADNTFTETGGKTASGTWAFSTLQGVITLTTTSPAAKVNWNYNVTATALGLTNNAPVTYTNPLKPLQYYLGEGLGFTH